MRYALFLLVAMFPSVALACAWVYEPSPPLHYLVASNVFAAIAAIFWVWSGPRETRSWIPEAIIAASVVASLGLVAFAEGDNWDNVSGIYSLVFLLLPYLAMRVEPSSQGKKSALVALLFLFGIVAGFFTMGAFHGTKTGGFQPADESVQSQVVF